MALTKKTINEILIADGDTTDTLEMDGVGTVYATGTFGGGTVTYLYSLDGGSTFLPLKDQTGTQIIYTSDDAVDFTTQTSILIKGNLAGSTGANVNIRIYR